MGGKPGKLIRLQLVSPRLTISFKGTCVPPLERVVYTRLLELSRYHSTTGTNSLFVVSDWITLVADYGQPPVSMGNQDRTLDTVDD